MTKKKLSTKTNLVLGGALGVALVLVGASTAYAAHYSDVALPGVTVAGTPVTGMTRAEVAEFVSQRADETEVIANIDGVTSSALLADLGVTVDAEATAANALEQNSSVVNRFAAAFNSHEVPVVYTIEETTLNQFSEQVVELVATPVHDGTVVLAETGDYFVATEANAGAGVDIEVLDQTVNRAAKTLESQEVTLEPVVVEPAVTTAEALQVAEQANALLDLHVVLYGTVSINPADRVDVAKWITIPNSEEGLGAPEFDPDKVTAWITKTAEATSDPAVDGIQNVDSAGNVVATPNAGSKGVVADNVPEIAAAAVAALTAGDSFEGQLTYREVEPNFEQRPVVAGSENLAYKPHAGQKWIDIDLTRNTVTAYEGATVVQGPVLMVHGMPGAETVTGTYPIYLKYEQQTMRGTRPDGSKYETEDVPWVMYFHGGYALHGAYWRSAFGYAGPSGSNGCINIPVEVSKWFYDWSELGTTVVSHY